MTIFDVETAADPLRARELMPAFEESEVRVGNIQDPAKIREKIAERRATHERTWLDGAALRPETGKVLAIGILPEDDQEMVVLHEGTETKILSDWWNILTRRQARSGSHFAGWGIYHFDLPFLFIRSRILGLEIPELLFVERHFSATRFCDIQEAWLLGRPRNEVELSLDYVARALGCGRKTGQGKNFAALYAFDVKAALAYLRNDLLLAKAIAGKLGLVHGSNH